MPTSIETGHAKNVAYFQELISFITGYGAAYNPSSVAIQLSSLQALHGTAQAHIQHVHTALVAFNHATNARILLFQSLRPLATRLVSAFSTTDASTEMLKDAKTINRKIQGKRAKEKHTTTDPATPAPATISASQQSYTLLIEHFSKLIALLQSEPSYAPHESALQISTLTTYLAALQSANTSVSSAYVALSNARIARNKILYKPKSGLFDIAAYAKNYVKALYGATAPEYKLISKIQFTKPKSI